MRSRIYDQIPITNKTAIQKNLKHVPLKINKKIKTYFHICLEEKKNETVGIFPTFLAQGITRDK